MVYREHAAPVPGVVLWRREAEAGAATRILPDACLDLIWDGVDLVVAGPDARARLHRTTERTSFTALRFSAGIGPAVLGVPAVELRDSSPRLDDLWPAARARELAERVATEPEGALQAWVTTAAGDVDPLGARLLALASGGAVVAGMADAVGLGVRHLHRASLRLFGYGPRHLVRVRRLERALELARRGVPLAAAASAAGYADQAHFSRDVRDLAGTTPRDLVAQAGSAAKRSTGVPSGSRTTA